MTEQNREKLDREFEGGFMVPDIQKESAYVLETNEGTFIYPSWVVTEEELLVVQEYEYYENRFIARLSAPGFLDSTDWIGPFETDDEAAESLLETYGVQ